MKDSRLPTDDWLGGKGDPGLSVEASPPVDQAQLLAFSKLDGGPPYLANRAEAQLEDIGKIGIKRQLQPKLLGYAGMVDQADVLMKSVRYVSVPNYANRSRWKVSGTSRAGVKAGHGMVEAGSAYGDWLLPFDRKKEAREEAGIIGIEAFWCSWMDVTTASGDSEYRARGYDHRVSKHELLSTSKPNWLILSVASCLAKLYFPGDIVVKGVTHNTVDRFLAGDEELAKQLIVFCHPSA